MASAEGPHDELGGSLALLDHWGLRILAWTTALFCAPLSRTDDPPEPDSFEAHSRDAMLARLGSVKPNWRWTVTSDTADDPSLVYRRQGLQSAWLTSLKHSVDLQALAMRYTPVVSFIFVLAGQIEITDRRTRKTLLIPPNHVASARQSAGNRMAIEPRSSWLAFHIPEQSLRRSFEDLTGRPYVQEFVLPPTRLSEDNGRVSIKHSDRQNEI
ncbi:hypothetical protein QN224_31895 [Sinorhizobium sp. 8-89]|uniref:hypothetical protein n=1 Tax=Sinorhizobium sp. 7-81 TaxID=3049087 RepID=UPI0024C2EA4D|nr:hypothetical protein [Sinorhizobium sp. 7-81]MDK1389931.1 hypothetical protein [Sinorhizobium sp. 7-81]